MAKVYQSFLRWGSRILKGVGQVFFLENPVAGLLLLLGIGINSLPMLLAALLGALSSTGMAQVMRYDREEIDRGLYGFNGTLVGIAVSLFCGVSLYSLILLVVGALLSTLLAHLLNKRCRIPAFTFPFVLVVWGILLLSGAGVLPALPAVGEEAPLLVEKFDLWSCLSYEVGQVMFQEGSLITGILFLLAIVVTSRELALYAVVGLLLSLPVALFDLFPVAEINDGLYGYNAVLVAMAVGSKSVRGMVKIAAGVLLSIVIQYAGLRAGVTTLTAPFVFATWIVLAVAHFTERKHAI